MAMFNERHMAEYNHIREGEVPEVTGVRLATHVPTASPAALPRPSAAILACANLLFSTAVLNYTERKDGLRTP